jgi:hypothetical protein
MMIPTVDIRENFDGYFVYDCAVRKNAYCFLLFEQHKTDKSNDEPKKRLVTYFPDFDGKPLVNGHNFFGFENPHLIIANKPKEQAIMLGLSGSVAVLGSGEGGLQDKIPRGKGLVMQGGVKAATNIDGYVYVAGGWRSVARRVDTNKWESIVDRKSMPEPKSADGIDPGGFRAISAFNAKDIYCAGGEGDVWRFDGAQWHRCPLPTNMFLYTVCCADDGFVYIGAQSGSIIKGRGDKWKVIHKGDLSLPFKDLVWYEGRVWCTSDYGLWTIENDKLVESPLPVDVTACSGNLAAGFGKLLLAGMHGATVYDGKKWERLI